MHTFTNYSRLTCTIYKHIGSYAYTNIYHPQAHIHIYKHTVGTQIIYTYANT